MHGVSSEQGQPAPRHASAALASTITFGPSLGAESSTNVSLTSMLASGAVAVSVCEQAGPSKQADTQNIRANRGLGWLAGSLQLLSSHRLHFSYSPLGGHAQTMRLSLPQ